MNTDEQLNRMCVEHEIHMIADMHREIAAFWDSIPNGARLAIRGAGMHTVELFHIVRFWEKNIVGIFDDAKAHADDLPYPILDVAQMENHDFDMIFFSSYRHRLEMMEALRDRFAESEYQYLDMYTYLFYEKNRMFSRDFYLETYFNEMHYVDDGFSVKITLELYYACQYYEKAKESNTKYAAYYLKVLISDYIKERDFVNALLYVDEYIACQYEGWETYARFKENLDELLDQIKRAVLSRKSSNATILFFLIDGWAYNFFADRETYRMDFLHAYTDQKGIEFQNAYSPGVFTTEAMRSVFSKENMLGEAFWDLDMHDSAVNVFYRHLKSKGFRIKTYGIFDMEAKRVEGPERHMNRLFWDILCDLREHDEPVFYYMHESGLFHNPTYCGRQSHVPISWGMQCRSNLQPAAVRKDAFQDSAQYLDKSLAFYFDYLSEESPKVIFADHGWGGTPMTCMPDRSFGSNLQSMCLC